MASVGLSVTGTIIPRESTEKSSVREGDAIILTKPLGAGPYSDAVAKDGLTPDQYSLFVGMMKRLNKYASER